MNLAYARNATRRLVMRPRVALPAFLLMCVCLRALGGSGDAFRIRVVDAATSRGVPLVRLSTLHGLAYWTDSAGVVAFQEPGLMGRDVYFAVESPGYTYPKDGFGNAGSTLHVSAGTSATLVLQRDNIAQRLYRITGAGIYADSILLGDQAPIREPILNASVLGQDSALAAVYKGQVHWIWGDTTNSRYPLAGNFRATGAVSDFPTSGGLDPDVGIDLRYFVQGDFVQPMVHSENGGVFWLDSLVAVRDGAGREHLVANCAKIRPPMETEARFFAEYDDSNSHFVLHPFPPDLVSDPAGHPFRMRDQGTDYIVFPGGMRLLRCRDSYEAVRDHAGYEGWTCLKPGSRFDGTSAQLERRSDGTLAWGWRRATSPVGVRELDQLESASLVAPPERWVAFHDVTTSRPVRYHGGSIAWNEYRHKWTQVFSEIGGSASLLGEIWYAEADAPTGPWGPSVKVATHPNYSFYNPVQHPYFARDAGRSIYFEGTYVTTFSGNIVPTPRYEYNQIMYRLDLDDPRLKPLQTVGGGQLGSCH